MAGRDFFDVLRVDIFSAHDNEVLLPPHHIQFPVQVEAKITRAVPAIHDRLSGEIGSVVITVEQAIALEVNLAGVALRELCA